MTDHALASFEAKDGTGRWEVFTWGIIANGQRYHFTKQSHIVCAGLPGAHREARLPDRGR